jgi:hypothetical protein
MQVSFGGPGAPGEPDGMASHGPGAFGPIYTGDVTDRVRVSSARPSRERHRRKRLPLIAAAIVGLAGAAAGVWLAVGRDGTSTSPASAEPAGAEPAGAEPAVAVPQPAEVPRPPEAPAGVPGSVGVPAKAAAPAAAAAPLAPADPAVGSPAMAADPRKPQETGAPNQRVQPAQPQPGTADSTDDPGVKPGKVVVQEPHPKAAKPRGRTDSKRADKRPRKEPKEPTWNADSPFLPQTTPKR